MHLVLVIFVHILKIYHFIDCFIFIQIRYYTVLFMFGSLSETNWDKEQFITRFNCLTLNSPSDTKFWSRSAYV